MNVVDSSAYLEYFRNGPNVAFFAPIIVNTADIIVPSIAIYEVFKKIRIDLNLAAAEEAVMHMKQGKLVNLDFEIALTSANLSIQYKLPMADSIIYATAQLHSATLWTQDRHFDGLPGVQFKAKVEIP